jgi:hypothetical protein
MNAEQRPTPRQMFFESPFRGIDAGLGSGLARVSDVDHNEVRLARFGQSVLDGFADRYGVAEPGDDVGQALRGLGKPMPRVAVTTSSADDQDFCHARDLYSRRAGSRFVVAR